MSEADPKVQAESAVEEAPETERRKRPWRLILMLSVPLVLLAIGGYMWLTSGRYVSTDNAYVQQDMVSVAPEVTGIISQVLVHENQHVIFRDHFGLSGVGAHCRNSAAKLQSRAARSHRTIGPPRQVSRPEGCIL